MVFILWVNILLWLTNGSFWRLKPVRALSSGVCFCYPRSLWRGGCFPSCYLVSSRGLSMVMLIFPEISTVFWLWEQIFGFGVVGSLGIKTQLPEAVSRAGANWERGVRPCSVSPDGRAVGWARCSSATPLEKLESISPLVMKRDFQGEKDNDEVKFHFQNEKGTGASVFCAGKKVKLL